MGAFKQFIREQEDYKGQHQAPGPDDGSPMHDVTKNGTYPKDFYSHNGFEYYSNHGERHDSAAHYAVVDRQGKPNKHIEIYRAVPKNVPRGTKINKGDWVTHTRAYAHEHGQSNLGGKGNYKIIKKTVRANELFTDGNSIHEWGYHPQPRDADYDKAVREKRAAKEAAMTPEEKAARQAKHDAFWKKHHETMTWINSLGKDK